MMSVEVWQREFGANGASTKEAILSLIVNDRTGTLQRFPGKLRFLASVLATFHAAIRTPGSTL